MFRNKSILYIAKTARKILHMYEYNICVIEKNSKNITSNLLGYYYILLIQKLLINT